MIVRAFAVFFDRDRSNKYQQHHNDEALLSDSQLEDREETLHDVW